MVDVDRYEPGTPCWVELATTDVAAARLFYGELFGWSFDEGPLPDGGVYVIPHLRGRGVGGMYQRQAGQSDAPPAWLLYVAVNDADDTASRVTALDGTLVAPPYDVMDSGRMAVLQDPTGATIALWQPRNAIGARIANEPGAFSWCELATRDPARAADFYCGLFGWGVKKAGEDYMEFRVGDRDVAGMYRLDETRGDAPPRWTAYFGVADCDEAAASAESNGGRTEMPPTDIEHVGRIAALADPQGARFAVWAGTSR
jgi:uncharacterized protein